MILEILDNFGLIFYNFCLYYVSFILFCSPNATQLHFLRAKTKSNLKLTLIDDIIDVNCFKNTP